MNQSDDVSSWEYLVNKWNASFASYRAAVEASELLAHLPTEAAERRSAEEQAFEAMMEIKQNIDRLISEAFQRRTQLTDSMVLGTFICQPFEEEQSPEKAARESKADRQSPGTD